MSDVLFFILETRVAFHAMLYLWIGFAIMIMTTFFRIGRAVGEDEHPSILWAYNGVLLFLAAISIIDSDYLVIADYCDLLEEEC